jgi:hypothetical protein
MNKKKSSVSDFALWSARCSDRLAEIESRSAERFVDSGELGKEIQQNSREIQQALNESALKVSELSAELFGHAFNLVGMRLLGGDLKVINRIERKIERLKVKIETHIDRLSVLVSDTKHLS